MTNGQKAVIWDVSGQERFRNLVSTFINNSIPKKDFIVVLMIYSSNKKESFDNVPRWFEIAKSASTTENKYIYLVCNREVYENIINISTEEGMAFAQKLNINFWELNIKENLGVQELWEKLQIIGSTHLQNIDVETKN